MAIHSRKADIAISRPMMTAAVKVTYHTGLRLTMSTNAVATMSLSATGSRKAPSRDVCPSLRAR